MRQTSLVSMGRLLLPTLFLFSIPALAGPPLICHPFEIDGAKSLPWAGGRDFNSPDPSYDVRHLTQDTLNLLGPNTPVIVRMETIRRAVLYGAKDQRAAYELLSRLTGEALSSEVSGKPDPLALFDAGYLIESLKQVTWLYKKNLAEGLDGVSMVLKAAGSGMDAPTMEFAASLMGESKWPNEHYRRALAGTQEGSLLARNLVTHSDGQGQSIAALRAKYGKTE